MFRQTIHPKTRSNSAEGIMLEKYAQFRFLEMGYCVYESVLLNSTDFLIETEEGFRKIQVKKVRQIQRKNKRTKHIHIILRRQLTRAYSPGEVDFFVGVQNGDAGIFGHDIKVFIIPYSVGNNREMGKRKLQEWLERWDLLPKPGGEYHENPMAPMQTM